MGIPRNTVNVSQGSSNVIEVISFGPQGPAGIFQDTGSLLVTASIASNSLTFTKGDNSSFSLTLPSSGTGSADTGSLLTSASIINDTLTFYQGDGTSFSVTVNNVQNAYSASYILASDVDTSVSFGDIITNNLTVTDNFTTNNLNIEGDLVIPGSVTATSFEGDVNWSNLTDIPQFVDTEGDPIVNQIAVFADTTTGLPTNLPFDLPLTNDGNPTIKGISGLSYDGSIFILVGDISASGVITTTGITSTGNIELIGDLSASGDITTTGNIELIGDLSTSGDITASAFSMNEVQLRSTGSPADLSFKWEGTDSGFYLDTSNTPTVPELGIPEFVYAGDPKLAFGSVVYAKSDINLDTNRLQFSSSTTFPSLISPSESPNLIYYSGTGSSFISGGLNVNVKGSSIIFQTNLNDSPFTNTSSGSIINETGQWYLTSSQMLVDAENIDFTKLPTSDPGVAGRLFQTGSDAIGATGGFQLVLVSQG